MIVKRCLATGMKPKAFYQSPPFLNFLDPNEASFLGQKYVRPI